MTVVGFHPIDDRRKVEIIKTDSGDYQWRMMVDGEQRGLTVGAFGPGLAGWQNCQASAYRHAKGIRRDAEMVR